MTISVSSDTSTVTLDYLSELSKRASIDTTDSNKYSIKNWISSVNRLYEEGDSEYYSGQVGNAYVYYLKGCSIMVEIIAKHPNSKEAKKDPVYQQLKARTNDSILSRLEEITQKIQASESRIQTKTEQPEEEDALENAMNKYPELDDDFWLNSLPSVPTHAPDKRHQNQRAPAPAPIPKLMKMPEPEPEQQQQQQQHATAATTALPKALQLPTPSNYPFQHTAAIDPNQLAAWISTKKNAQPKPSVLLLDIRSRDIFDQGFIKHKWVAQIEPLVLQENVQSSKIEESMVMNLDVEQQMFEGRNCFDFIVYYDQNSTQYNQRSSPLYHFFHATYELEFIKVLQRAPVMLIGGFDAWKSTIGDHGIYKYTKDSSTTLPSPANSATASPQNQHTHWLRDVVGKGSSGYDTELTPVKVHHTVYDYFSYTGSSGRKESMSQSNNNNHINRVYTPPLRGIFSNTLNNQPNANSTAQRMPTPQSALAPNNSNTTKYPNHPSTLQRKKTFIDNPFHGFTATKNQQFDVPPLPPKQPYQTLQPSNIPPPLPPKIHNTVASPPLNYRQAPVSDNSFSQITTMIGTTGLKNLGNTCFMNSIIQCLSGTIPFARYFISGIYKQHINTSNPLGTGGTLADQFAKLLRTMWGENYNSISPTLFRESLIKFAPQFRGSEQHDSQEFLNFLLDGIHEDCNLIVKKPVPHEDTEEEEARFERLPDWQASAIAWERYLARNSSVVVSLFQGQYKSRLECMTCGVTSTTYNSFMSLSLPIPSSKRRVSVYDCLDYFVTSEVLEKENAWNCPRCKTARKATKSLTLTKLPDVLLVHLKRFSYDGPFKNKLETVVDTPMTGLDLSRYIPRSMFRPDQSSEGVGFCYDLYAVSNHFGSLTGGHYTACVRNGYKDEWRNFDDSRFSIIDPSKVVTGAAYNLFYVRASVQ